jgi:hypothetical protein
VKERLKEADNITELNNNNNKQQQLDEEVCICAVDGAQLQLRMQDLQRCLSLFRDVQLIRFRTSISVRLKSKI